MRRYPAHKSCTTGQNSFSPSHRCTAGRAHGTHLGDLLPQVTLAILARRAADCGVRQQVIVVVAKVGQRAVSPVALQVADKLRLLRVAPAPVAESLQDGVFARAPPRVGGKLFEVPSDLAFQQKGGALFDPKAVSAVVAESPIVLHAPRCQDLHDSRVVCRAAPRRSHAPRSTREQHLGR
jgi:hypothetical protein